MVALLAFAATAVSTVFAQSLLVRWTRRRRPHEGCWAFALALFALASAAFAVGASTGWDAGTFRVFYLLGAIVNVPWLALGTLYLHAPRLAARVRSGLVLFTGLAGGVVLVAPLQAEVPTATIPEGRQLFDAFPRILAAAGSGLGAAVIVAGAAWSIGRYLVGTERRPRTAASNGLIALGTLVLSAGGTLQGVAGGEDEAFAVSLALGVTVIYAGFLVAVGPSLQEARAVTPDAGASRRHLSDPRAPDPPDGGG